MQRYQQIKSYIQGYIITNLKMVLNREYSYVSGTIYTKAQYSTIDIIITRP